MEPGDSSSDAARRQRFPIEFRPFFRLASQPRRFRQAWEFSTSKVAIVTGSARGIGRATAELLSEQGAKVLINDLDGDVAEQTASEIAGETRRLRAAT